MAGDDRRAKKLNMRRKYSPITSFTRITVWMVEETRTNYMVFGHTESPVDLERLSHKSKQKYIVNVVGGINTRYTAFDTLI